MKVSSKHLLAFALTALTMLIFTTPVQSFNPIYLSAIDAAKYPTFIDLTAPISTQWHELYCEYSQEWHLTSWEDSDLSGNLTASDQIDMTKLTEPGKGNIYWFHVERVTVTIHWTWKPPTPPGIDPTEPVSSEPEETMLYQEDLPPPISTQWHMIYPDFCRPFHISSWEDTDGSGTFTPSDQFDITFKDDGTGPWYAHLDAISTDIIITQKTNPNPIPEFPLAATLELALAVTVAYIWLKRKPKITA